MEGDETRLGKEALRTSTEMRRRPSLSSPTPDPAPMELALSNQQGAPRRLFSNLDLATPTSSPEGRLFQVEYDIEAIKVGNRIIKKRIHVSVEHAQPSRC